MVGLRVEREAEAWGSYAVTRGSWLGRHASKQTPTPRSSSKGSSTTTSQAQHDALVGPITQHLIKQGRLVLHLRSSALALFGQKHATHRQAQGSRVKCNLFTPETLFISRRRHISTSISPFLAATQQHKACKADNRPARSHA